MKRLTTLISLILITIFACKKDNPEPEIKEANYSTFEGEIGHNDNSTIVSSDNNLIICGNSNNHGFWSLIKTTKSGMELWNKDIPGDGWLMNGCALAEAQNGDLFVCGDTPKNWPASQLDILLVKTDPNGDTLWTKTYGQHYYDYAQNIIATSDGNILISSYSVSSGNDSIGDIFLIKLNYNGDTLWTNSYVNSGNEFPNHLLETNNGGYLITGTYQQNDNPNEIYLLKVDINGAKLWDRKISSITGQYGHSTIELSNENLVICGYRSGGIEGNSQILVLETDNHGNTIWLKEFGDDNSPEKGNSIKQNLDETFTIMGSSSPNSSDLILLKIDQTGNQVWFKKIGVAGEDNRGKNLIKDSNDDNLITGNFGWSGPIFLTTTDKDGNFK